jgi:ketosteroid isomerase-like protein
MATTEELERIRNGYERFARTRELPPGMFHPEIAWDLTTTEAWAEQQVYRGHDGVRRFVADWLEAWADYDFEVDDVVEAGERVLVLGHQHAMAKGSGVPVEMHGAHVITLREGLITHVRLYSSQEDALRDLGVPEERRA